MLSTSALIAEEDCSINNHPQYFLTKDGDLDLKYEKVTDVAKEHILQ